MPRCHDGFCASGWARDCHYASFHFLCFNQLQLTLENNIYPLHKMISALMTMTKKRPSPIVCHLDKHSQWGPCSWRKKNPSNVNRTSCKKKKKYLSKECFMRKLPCLGLAMHFVKKGGISVCLSLCPISAVCLHFLGTWFQGSNNLCHPVPA